MSKKAIIVEYTFMTRVIIDTEKENIDEVVRLSKQNIIDKINNDELHDNLSEWYDDEEMPYNEDDE